MTNSSLRYALKIAAAGSTFALILCGCGAKDGLKELAEGKAAYEIKDYRKAEHLFEKGLGYAPENVEILLCLARVKLDLGEIAESCKFINAAQQYGGGDIDVRQLSGQIAWHAKDYNRAAEIFRGIVTDMSLDAKTRARALAEIGIVEMSLNRPHLARVAFLKAIRLDRYNAAACYHLGLVYRDAPFGYNDAALEQFEKFVRLDVEASPRVQKVQRSVIPALKELIAGTLTSRPGSSRRDSSACAEALTKADEAWKKNQFKTAKLRYEEALKADSLSARAALGLARSVLKTDATRNGDKKALEYYRTACTLSPMSSNTLLETGKHAMKLGYYQQAAEAYSRALAANCVSRPAIEGLIAAFGKIGYRKAEIKAYREYLDMLPKAQKK